MALDRAEIAARLRQDISSGYYGPGDKLPAQRELATRLGAAPNTVGEALKLLAGEGLVRIRARSGVVVREPVSDAEAAVDPVVEAREALTQIQAEVREARSILGAVERRVADSLDRLDRLT